MKDIIVFINIGSYCDGTLTNAVIKKLLYKYDVKFITDKSSIIENSVIKPTEVYDSPSFITVEPVIGGADTNTSLATWLFSSPTQIHELYTMIKTIRDIISRQQEQHKPKMILFHYSLMNVALNFEQNNICSFGLIYYSPAYINNNIPWIFDGNIRRRDFQLYDKSKNKAVIERSWKTIMSRTKLMTQVLQSGVTEKVIYDRMKKLHIFLCWDKHMTKDIKPLTKKSNIHYIGGVYPDHIIKKIPMEKKEFKEIHRNLKSFMKEQKRMKKLIALVSFGSFAKFPHLRSSFQDIVRILQLFNYSVIIHKTWNIKDEKENEEFVGKFMANDVNNNIFVQIGFAPYDYIVPHIDLILFTGSLCLQLVAFQTMKNMIFFPLITEQFFWAKNYEHFTKIPYVDVAEVYKMSIPLQVKRSLERVQGIDERNNEKKRQYQYMVQKSMKENINKNVLVAEIGKIIETS